jgi:hypothetical protein
MAQPRAVAEVEFMNSVCTHHVLVVWSNQPIQEETTLTVKIPGRPPEISKRLNLIPLVVLLEVFHQLREATRNTTRCSVAV